MEEEGRMLVPSQGTTTQVVQAQPLKSIASVVVKFEHAMNYHRVLLKCDSDAVRLEGGLSFSVLLRISQRMLTLLVH